MVQRPIHPCLASFIATAAICAGCEAPRPAPEAPEPTLSVAIHTCVVTPSEGFTQTTDEAGKVLYVANLPFVTEDDVQTASLVQSEKRNLIQLEFTPPAAERLARLTTERRGVRLAIYLDGKLIMSPWIWQPITRGSAMLDGEFTRAQAKDIVRRLNNQRADWSRRVRRGGVIEVEP